MKKFFVALLCLSAVFCLSLGISACTGGGDPSGKVPSTPTTPTTPTTPSTPSTPDDGKEEGGKDGEDDEEKQKEEAAKSLAEAVERLDTFLGRVGNNYCYTAAGTQYELASDVLQVTEGETAVYYTRDEEEHYIIARNGEIWERDFCRDIGVWETAENCLSGLENVEWTAYAEGELRAEGILLRFTGEGDKTAVSWVKDGADFALSEVGEVEIVLPAYKDLAQYVYETVDGVRKYNIPTLAHVLEETLKADSSILTKACAGITTTLVKITHVKNNEGELGFGTVCLGSNGSKSYRYFIFKNKFDESNLTVGNFKKSLIVGSLKMGDISAFEISTFENDEEFNIMAQNVLKKLAQDGCQGESINNKADPLPEYENAEILFAYCTPQDLGGYAFDMGDQHSRKYMLLIKHNGVLEEVKTRVAVAIGGNHLLNYNKEKVLVITLEREEIDSENAKLYAENDSASVSAALPVTLFYEEKRR